MVEKSEGMGGLRVLVTGGNRGLGEATVRRFVRAGATVLAASRGKPEPSSAATFIAADLSTEEGVADLGPPGDRPCWWGGRAREQCGRSECSCADSGPAGGVLAGRFGDALPQLRAPGPGPGAGDGRAGLGCRRAHLVDRQPAAASW